jgi:alkylhydroperoxidase family enzyme
VRRKLTQTSLRGLSLLQVHHVAPVRFNAARDGVAQVYQELERDFGILAPPIALHSPAPDVLAAGWLMLRETLLVPGLVPREQKEAVASAVSIANECPFCVGMHTATMNSMVPGGRSKADKDTLDPSVQAVYDWAQDNTLRETAGQRPAPFPPEQIPELVGVAVDLQYLNRMVNIFLDAVPLPPGVPRSSLGTVMRILTWLIGSASRSGPKPGVSLDLLPPAPLPEDLSWAAGNPVIADAFARGSAAMDKAGARSVPESVRELLHGELAAWDGQPRGISRSWVEDATAVLEPEARAAGRLALLTAFASYQVDKTVIASFKESGADDSALIDITAWASLSAARRVGSWVQTKN